jgi:hypothetical protein
MNNLSHTKQTIRGFYIEKNAGLERIPTSITAFAKGRIWLLCSMQKLSENQALEGLIAS